jgi:hypothetical protein
MESFLILMRATIATGLSASGHAYVKNVLRRDADVSACFKGLAAPKKGFG